MNIECIIFDFDGVIADTDQGRFQLLRKLLNDYDIQLEVDDFDKLIGYSTQSFLKENFPELTEAHISDVIKRRHVEYFADLSKYCIPFENMSTTINELAKNYSLAIVTTHTTENARKQLEHLSIDHHFNWIIGREFSEDKNLNKTYVKIPSLIGIAPDTCIVVEDSSIGVKSAKKAGYYCINFNPTGQAFNQDADVIVNGYDELKNKLDSFQGV